MNSKKILGIVLPIFFILSIFFYKKHVFHISDSILGKILFFCVILFYSEINLIYGVLALVIIIFFYKYGVITQEKDTTYTLNSVPLIIYQTWNTKDLPPKMAQCVERLKTGHPQFEHYLYDDNDCRAFIRDNYDKEVLNAYDKLIPGAYKADLWRYCVLYKTGGIYLDIKFQCENGFSLMEFTKDSETFVLDRPYGDPSLVMNVNLQIINSPSFYDNLLNYTEDKWNNKQIGLYNAVMASVPNNPVLYNCIQQIVKNVNEKKYGHNPLYPTGPGLLGEAYFTPFCIGQSESELDNETKNMCRKEYISKVKKIKYFNSIQGTYILNKKQKVLSQYPNYREEQRKYSNKGPMFYYHDLWYNKNIYLL